MIGDKKGILSLDFIFNTDFSGRSAWQRIHKQGWAGEIIFRVRYRLKIFLIGVFGSNGIAEHDTYFFSGVLLQKRTALKQYFCRHDRQLALIIHFIELRIIGVRVLVKGLDKRFERGWIRREQRGTIHCGSVVFNAAVAGQKQQLSNFLIGPPMRC